MCFYGEGVFYTSHSLKKSWSVETWPFPLQAGDGPGVLFEKLPAAGGPRVLPKVDGFFGDLLAGSRRRVQYASLFFSNVDMYILCIYI